VTKAENEKKKTFFIEEIKVSFEKRL